MPGRRHAWRGAANDSIVARHRQLRATPRRGAVPPATVASRDIAFRHNQRVMIALLKIVSDVDIKMKHRRDESAACHERRAPSRADAPAPRA